MLRVHPGSSGRSVDPADRCWGADLPEDDDDDNMESSGAGSGGTLPGVPGLSVTAPMLPNNNLQNNHIMMNNSSTGGTGGAYPSSTKRPWWQRLTRRYDFPTSDLEIIYQKYIFKLRLSSVVALLLLVIVLTATLAVLNFLFVSGVTVENISHVAQCVLFILLFVYIHTRYMQEAHLVVVNLIILFLCVCFAVVALPVEFGDRPGTGHHTPADGVWQVTLVVFLVYALLPFKIYVALAAGLLLPTTHVLVSIFITPHEQWLLWRQVSKLMETFMISSITFISLLLLSGMRIQGKYCFSAFMRTSFCTLQKMNVPAWCYL